MEKQVASVVPFHCIICFDEFNLTDKAPVILPCGHTYLCEPCSKRIKTCMECRTPLFWTPPPRPAAPLTPSYRNNIASQRYRYQHQNPAPASPVKPPEPIALPVPKNVVLLAMLEAAERQCMMAASVMDISQDEIEDDASGEGEDEDAEIKRIIAGMESLTGPCGTYAVREEEGLAVLPQDPRRRSHQEQVRDPAESRDPFMVEKGQTIQVVDIENGVAKLARGMGYIVAGGAQLVKVGGPLDKSCQLEGTLNLVEQRKRDLQRQLEQVGKVSECLRTEIEGVETEDPTHPIITLPPVPDESKEENPTICPGSPAQGLEKPVTHTICESPTIVTEADDCVELTHSPSTPGRNPSMPTDLGSPFSIDNADINGAFSRRLSTAEDGLLSIYQRLEDNDPPGIVEVGCSSFLFGRICASDDDDDARQLIGLSFDDSEGSDVVSPPRPQALPPSMTSNASVGSASTSQQPFSSPQRTSSFDTIDFRTGMSGHRALLSSRTSDHRGLPQSRGSRLMMSQHMGIGRVRGPASGRPRPTTPSTSTKGSA